MNLPSKFTQAEERIHPYIRETPLDHTLALSEMGQSNVYLKLENLQYTGSFKLRGAMNKLLNLTPEERAQGIVTASSGNHGAAVAYGLKRLGLPGQLVGWVEPAARPNLFHAGNLLGFTGFNPTWF